MGPPLKAAENAKKAVITLLESRFNGAAAKSSGKCGSEGWRKLRNELASMGPPLKAAENLAASLSA